MNSCSFSVLKTIFKRLQNFQQDLKLGSLMIFPAVVVEFDSCLVELFRQIAQTAALVDSISTVGMFSRFLETKYRQNVILLEIKSKSTLNFSKRSYCLMSLEEGLWVARRFGVIQSQFKPSNSGGFLLFFRQFSCLQDLPPQNLQMNLIPVLHSIGFLRGQARLLTLLLEG